MSGAIHIEKAAESPPDHIENAQLLLLSFAFADKGQCFINSGQ